MTTRITELLGIKYPVIQGGMQPPYQTPEDSALSRAEPLRSTISENR